MTDDIPTIVAEVKQVMEALREENDALTAELDYLTNRIQRLHYVICDMMSKGTPEDPSDIVVMAERELFAMLETIREKP